MNYYPVQLEQIAKMCRALNSIDDSSQDSSMALSLRNRIAVEDEGGILFGYLIDEIGGAWSFEPVKDGDQ